MPQTAGLQRDPPPVLQPAPALTVVVGVIFCASLGPCACTMLCVRMAFPSDGGSRGGNSTASHPMRPHRIHAIPDSHQGCRSRTLSALVVPVGLALVPTLNTLGSPLCPKTCAPQAGGGLSSVGEECAGPTHKKYCQRGRSKLLTTRQPGSCSPVAPEYFPDHSPEHVGRQYNQMVKSITQKSIIKNNGGRWGGEVH